MNYDKKVKISGSISAICLAVAGSAYYTRGVKEYKALIIASIIGAIIGIPTAILAMYYKSMQKSENNDLDLMGMDMVAKLPEDDKVYIERKISKE